MAKPFVTVSLLLHGADSSLDIADYVDNSGKFVALGQYASAALARGEQLHFNDAEGIEVIIPYHAVVEYNVTKTTDDVTPADDAFCIESVINNTSFTVSFYNGETLLQSTVVKEGGVPIYDGTTPKKDCYTFLGWNTDKTADAPLEELPPVEDTTSYYAIFEKIEYTITWMNGDTKLDDDEVECGETPAYTGETPTGTGTFVGWSATPDGEALETIPPATADATYYAVFIV